MVTLILCSFLLALAFYILRMWIARALAWIAMGLGVVTAYRVATLVDTRLADREFFIYPIIGGALGFLVVGILCAAWIRHGLIWFYLQRANARNREAAQAGKLW